MSKNQQAISAGHEVTLTAARNMLEDGGNAFDAAIAAYAAACIAEPCMASAGAGAFAHVYVKGQQPYLLDFFCQTPKVKNRNRDLQFFPIPVDFGDAQETYYGGLAAMAVPGAIAGLYALHRRHATRPMTVLLEQAIQLAKTGVAINSFQHYDMSLLHTIFDHQDRAKELFKPTGQLLEIGEQLCLPEFADFLDYMGHEGPDAFYQGEVAQKLVKACQEQGGFLSLDDLKAYQVLIRQPLKSACGAYDIFANPLPAVGGALLTVALDTLQSQPSKKAEDLLACFSAMESMEKNPSRLGDYLKGRNRRGATSHFNIVDRWGNAVALTMTVGEGSGYFIPGTDIHMNNMLGEQSLVPNGWHSWTPDTRLSTMMCPTLVFDQQQRLEMVLGSGGASRIPGAILQVLRYALSEGLPIAESVQGARMHLENGKLDVEPNFKLDESNIPPELEYKFWTKSSMFFGGVHAICRRRNSWEAIGDERRDGVAWVG